MQKFTRTRVDDRSRTKFYSIHLSIVTSLFNVTAITSIFLSSSFVANASDCVSSAASKDKLILEIRALASRKDIDEMTVSEFVRILIDAGEFEDASTLISDFGLHLPFDRLEIAQQLFENGQPDEALSIMHSPRSFLTDDEINRAILLGLASPESRVSDNQFMELVEGLRSSSREIAKLCRACSQTLKSKRNGGQIPVNAKFFESNYASIKSMDLEGELLAIIAISIAMVDSDLCVKYLNEELPRLSFDDLQYCVSSHCEFIGTKAVYELIDSIEDEVLQQRLIGYALICIRDNFSGERTINELLNLIEKYQLEERFACTYTDLCLLKGVPSEDVTRKFVKPESRMFATLQISEYAILNGSIKDCIELVDSSIHIYLQHCKEMSLETRCEYALKLIPFLTQSLHTENLDITEMLAEIETETLKLPEFYSFEQSYNVQLLLSIADALLKFDKPDQAYEIWTKIIRNRGLRGRLFTRSVPKLNFDLIQLLERRLNFGELVDQILDDSVGEHLGEHLYAGKSIGSYAYRTNRSLTATLMEIPGKWIWEKHGGIAVGYLKEKYKTLLQ